MKRYLEKYIQSDLKRKIVLLTGPRQTGKTTLARMLTADFDYFNYDNAEQRISLLEKSWDRSRKLVIFDELHKMKNWKSWLKGIYDTEKIPSSLIVTGSAKLDAYKKVGEYRAGSLATKWKMRTLRNRNRLLNSSAISNPFISASHPIRIGPMTKPRSLMARYAPMPTL